MPEAYDNAGAFASVSSDLNRVLWFRPPANRADALTPAWSVEQEALTGPAIATRVSGDSCRRVFWSSRLKCFVNAARTTVFQALTNTRAV